MLFNECFDILVLTCDDPIVLKHHQVIKRITSSHNPLSLSPVMIVADPFLVVREDTLYLFYEEYRYSDKGIIKMISTRDLVMWSRPQTVLAENFHLSYPWVFEHDGQWYMIPETSAVHEIRLYKAVDNRLDCFELDKTLLCHGVHEKNPVMDFCDSSIIKKDGVFYLFTTVNYGNGNELQLYYSESLKEKYILHPQSPLMKDDKYGRNGGGLLEYQGVMYRFAQDCDGEYGNNINSFMVKSLSKTRYEEEILHEHMFTSNGLRGGHQYNFVNFKGKYVVVIDQKRRFPFLCCKAKRLFKMLRK